MPRGRVVWRNARDYGCWRKDDVSDNLACRARDWIDSTLVSLTPLYVAKPVQNSGCRDALGLEPAVQIVVDTIFNLCMGHGGCDITTVIATSQDAVNTQTAAASGSSLFHIPACPDGYEPFADLCYPPDTRLFTSQHLKMLSGDTLGVAGASRSALALACGFAYFLASIGVEATITSVYSAVRNHVYFRSRIVGWEAWEGDEPDENAVEEMKSAAASINGELPFGVSEMVERSLN